MTACSHSACSSVESVGWCADRHLHNSNDAAAVEIEVHMTAAILRIVEQHGICLPVEDSPCGQSIDLLLTVVRAARR